MKKVKLLLEPQEVEMIRDALEICYDEGDADDDEMLEGLCKAFGILTMSGNFVKVSVDERTEYIDDDTDPDAVDPDDCQCDECRADRGLPPLSGACDGDPDNDGAPQVWDSTKDSWDADDDDVDPDAVDPDDESCWDTGDDSDDDNGFCDDCGCSDCVCDDDDPDHVGCGVTKQDLENAWNANEPWNTNEK